MTGDEFPAPGRISVEAVAAGEEQAPGPVTHPHKGAVGRDPADTGVGSRGRIIQPVYHPGESVGLLSRPSERSDDFGE